MTWRQGLFIDDGFVDLRGICTKFQVWLDTFQLCGINLKDLQPQSGIYKEKIEKLKCLAAWHGLETHGGGWGKAKLDKLDKSGALQGGTVRVRASRSWARPAPRSEFFYLIGRAANRPNGDMCCDQGLHGTQLELTTRSAEQCT